MVFVGWRSALKQISPDFKEIWITFIRAFNRLKNDEAQLKALSGQAEILANLILKKNKAIKDEKVNTSLTALGTILDTMRTQILEMVANTSEMEKMEFSLRRRNVEKEIKQAKKNIALCADVLEEYEKTKEMTPQQLSRRQFFQRVGQISKKGLALMLVGSSGLTTGMYTALLELSKDLPLKKEDGLAILISYGTFYWWDTALKPFGKLFVPAYVARVEIAFGQKANVVKTGATSKDLFDVLHDKSIQNIVVFGHGSWGQWAATDRLVTSDEFEYNGWKNNKKNGLFIRHTCGNYRTTDETKLLLNEKEFEALERECQIIKEEMKALDPKMTFNLKFIKTYVKGAKELDKRKTGRVLLELSWNGKNLLSEKMDAVLSIEKIRKSVLRRINEFARQFANNSIEEKVLVFLEHIGLYLQKNRGQKEYEYHLFGTPQYPRDRIRGWDRTSYPWEFMIDVFGDRKLDQLYAKK